MSDQKAISNFEEFLDNARGAYVRAIAKLREAQNEVDILRRAMGSIEDSVEQTTKAIDSLGRALGTENEPRSFSSTLRFDDDSQSRQRGGGSEPTNIRELRGREGSRESSVAYMNQNGTRPPVVNDYERSKDRFSDRTITQSATMLLREVGRPLHVNELYNLLTDGGMTFKGSNPTISVAVSLSRSSRFRKVSPGTFDLVMREAAQVAS